MNDYGHAEIVAVDPTRDEWLDLRQQGIGGSDVAAVCNLSPYTSAVELWAHKTGQLTADDETSEAARWGNLLEGAVADETAERLGLTIVNPNVLLRHPDFPWMIGTPDRLARDQHGRLGPLEIKTAAGIAAGDWTDDEIPHTAALQLHHYMLVLGADVGWIGALVATYGGHRLEVREVAYDHSLGEALIAAESRFWQHVQDETMPPVDESKATSQTLADLYDALHIDGEMEIDSATDALVTALEEVKADQKPLADLRASIENELKARLLDAGVHVGLVDGDRRVSYRPQSSTRVSAQRVKDAFPDDWQDRFGETTETRVLRTHRPKKKGAA